MGDVKDLQGPLWRWRKRLLKEGLKGVLYSSQNVDISEHIREGCDLW